MNEAILRLSSLVRAAARRPEGYLETVLAAGVVDGDIVRIPRGKYLKLVQQFGATDTNPCACPSGGPGTEMKALLAKIGITATPNCSCNKRARIMDEKGCDWCEEHIDEIDGWLAEEAKKRKLPYLSLAGRLLISLAIRRARKRDNS